MLLVVRDDRIRICSSSNSELFLIWYHVFYDYSWWSFNLFENFNHSLDTVCPCHQCVRNLYTLRIFRQECVMENVFLCLSTEPPCYSVLWGSLGSLEFALFQVVWHLSKHCCFSRWNFTRWSFTSVPSHPTAQAGSVPAAPCASTCFPEVLPLFPLHCLAWVHLRYELPVEYVKHQKISPAKDSSPVLVMILLSKQRC